jgi:hypothetical protein
MSCSKDGVKCKDCGELPEIQKYCGDNGTSFNGCAYRLECRCGDKGQEILKSEEMAVLHWESEGFKSKKPKVEGAK